MSKETSKRIAPGVALILPQQARQALMAAASIDPHVQRTESQERTNALDHVTRNLKLKYPQFFK